MTRDLIAGGMYGDCLPSGFFAVLVPRSHVLTHLGIVPLPEGETFGPLFLRCTDVGGFRFAGQAHDSLDPAAYERVGSKWNALPPPCAGVSPLIYDLNGVLHRSNGSVGSQGYRYVNAQNQLISGDASYRIDLGAGRLLFEYTDLGDGLLIGQGATDGSGVRVWDGSTLRQLELGECRFIRANRVGDRVALAFTRPEGVVLIQTAMAELRALPPVVFEKVPGPIVYQPEEKEPVMEVPDRSVFVASFLGPRLRWFQGDEPRTVAHSFAQLNALVTELAKADPNWGLLEKTGGNQVRDRAADIALYRISPTEAQVVDVIGDAEGHDGPPRSGWTVKDIRPISQWKPPYPDVTPPVEPPPAQPPSQPPSQPPAPGLEARLAALEAAQKKTAGDVLRMAEAVETLKNRPAPVPVVPSYRVVGSTSRTFGHSHQLDVRLEPIP